MDDGLTTTGQTAKRWKTTEIELKIKQIGGGMKRKEEQKSTGKVKVIQLSVIKRNNI